MKNMTLLILVLFAGPVFAQVAVSAAMFEVAEGGPHELVGSLSIRFIENFFPDVSQEHPVYFQIKFKNGVVLADTLVDPTSSDPLLRLPIFLAMWSSTKVLAPGTTAAIVAWRAGQSDLWIRIQHPSSGWLEIDGQVRPPDWDHPINFRIGTRAEYQLEALPTNISWKNLPFNTRDANLSPDSTLLSDSVSTLLCVDLSKSDQLDYGALVIYEGQFWGDDSKNPSGLYEPGSLLPIFITGPNRNGRVKKRSCFVDCEEVLPEILAPSHGSWQIHEQNLHFNSGCQEGPQYLAGGRTVGPTSGLRLTTLGDSYGFNENSLTLVDPMIEGIVSLEEPFLSGDRTLYRTLHLGWAELTALPDAFEVNFQVEINGEMPTEELVFEWTIQVENGICPNSAVLLGQQTIHGARPAQLQGAALIPHLTRADGGFLTQLIFTNPSLSLARFHITSFSQEGNSLASVPISLEPGQTAAFPVAGLLGQAEHAYLSIPFQQNGALLAEYRADRPDATVARVMPKAVSSTDFRLFPGDGVLSWDGIAFVNGGLESTAVVISQKDFTGQILDIQVLDPLAAGSKRLYLPESDFNLQENTYFDIHADQSLYQTALRGDRSSNLLWENQVLVLPGTTPVPETGSEQGN